MPSGVERAAAEGFFAAVLLIKNPTIKGWMGGWYVDYEHGVGANNKGPELLRNALTGADERGWRLMICPSGSPQRIRIAVFKSDG